MLSPLVVAAFLIQAPPPRKSDASAVGRVDLGQLTTEFSMSGRSKIQPALEFTRLQSTLDVLTVSAPGPGVFKLRFSATQFVSRNRAALGCSVSVWAATR